MCWGYDHDKQGVMPDMLDAGGRRTELEHNYAISVDRVFQGSENNFAEAAIGTGVTVDGI